MGFDNECYRGNLVSLGQKKDKHNHGISKRSTDDRNDDLLQQQGPDL